MALQELPEKVLNEILSKLEPKHRLVVRKVCRILRRLVSFEVIDFKITSEAKVELKFDEFCIKWPRKIKGNDCIGMALNDLQSWLKMPLKMLCIDTGEQTEHFEELIDRLKSMKPVQADILGLWMSVDQCIKLFPYFEAGKLERIAMHYEEEELDKFHELTLLEQWKKAKRLLFEPQVGVDTNETPIEAFFHREFFTLNVLQISDQDARKIKEILLKKPNFKGCVFECWTETDVSRLFQPIIEFPREHPDTAKFEYSTNGSKFSIVVHCRWSVYISRM